MIRRLWPFVMGSFALGLDAYVVAGLVPEIATSFGTGEAAVGLGVAAFTGAYAISGPLLAGPAGRRTRGSLLAALAVFTLSNAASAMSTTIAPFLAARAVAGAAAGVYSPVSSAVAARLAGAERRGRALSLVLSGLAIGTVLGVPLGLLLADRWGWRAPFLLITAAGAASLAGVLVRGGGLPEVPSSTAMQRMRSIARTDSLLSVIVTALTGVASLGLYTYLAVVLEQSSLAGHQTLAIWVWGLGGAVGALGIGHVLDRRAPLRLSMALLAGLACALAGMTLSWDPAVLLVCLFVWGLCGWASLAPQQHVLLEATPGDGATAVAANASANYLGSAIGAGLGSVLLTQAATGRMLCLLAASIAALALVLQLGRARMEPRGGQLRGRR